MPKGARHLLNLTPKTGLTRQAAPKGATVRPRQLLAQHGTRRGSRGSRKVAMNGRHRADVPIMTQRDA